MELEICGITHFMDDLYKYVLIYSNDKTIFLYEVIRTVIPQNYPIGTLPLFTTNSNCQTIEWKFIIF